VVGRLPKHSWHGPVGEASYCARCTDAGLITIDLGSHTQLRTTTCFKHARAKIGITQFDSHVEVEEDGTEVVAIDGVMEIEDCSPKHITATMWAQFPDGGRVEASIDAPLQEAMIIE
jgi:hypothetical protein